MSRKWTKLKWTKLDAGMGLDELRKYDFNVSGGRYWDTGALLCVLARCRHSTHAEAFLALTSRGRPPGSAGQGLRLQRFITGISDRLIIIHF